MKQLMRLLALLAALALVAAACGSDDEEADEGSDTTTEETTADDETTDDDSSDDDSSDDAGADDAGADDAGSDDATAEDGPFRIAIVAPSAANDLAFTQSIVDAVERLDGVEYDISENQFVVEDAAGLLRGYAEDDYDLVIAHGSQYGGTVETLAAEFPEVAFAWGTAADNFGLDNVSAYTAASDQGGYVLGTLAAALVGDGSIGVVGPIEVGDAKLYVDGFKAGVVDAGGEEPGVNYIESFSDVALATEAATAFVDNGATVLTGTAQMTVGPIGVADENGVAWFGTQSNQTQLAPDVIVANQVYHWEVVLEDLVADIRSGDLGGEIYEITLENEGLVIEYNDGYDLADDARAAADDAVAGIIDGSVSTGA